MCSRYVTCGNRHKKVSKYRRDYKGRFDKDRRLYKYFIISFMIYGISMIGANTIWGWIKNFDRVLTVDNSLANIEYHIPTMREEVLGMVRDAGLDVELADRIVQHESWWREDNSHLNKDGTIDRGLWMLNSYFHSEVPDSCAYEYYCATKQAIRIWKERGPQEWIAYRYVK